MVLSFRKIFFIFLFTLCASILFARDITINVIDSDLELPLEGAVIRLRDGKEFTCDRSGRVVIQAPDDRQLIVYALYPGYETSIMTIPAAGNSFTIMLRLSGVMQGRELVVEAEKPGSSESKTGRSVAISGREIAQSAQIGVIEDVMNAIKLLPGVGYTGSFNAQPSVRGGHPGDMSAALDGFYITNPYHWGGSISIFDPRMVQSAQLSHGVFTTRYGHTISGLLDINTKKASPAETEFEIGMSTSMTSVSLSFPFSGKGGILLMGRITYYDPIIKLAQLLSDYIPIEQFDQVNSIRVAPYIRSAALNGNYRFTSNLEIQATGFFGMDGVGVSFFNEPVTDGEFTNSSKRVFDFTNYQVFLITSLNWNPHRDMLFKFSAGAGYEEAFIKGDSESSVRRNIFSDAFIDKYGLRDGDENDENDLKPAPYLSQQRMEQSENKFNVQLRLDYDWEITDGLIIAAGVQEMITRIGSQGQQERLTSIHFSGLSEKDKLFLKTRYKNLPENFWNDAVIPITVPEPPRASNDLFVTSAYMLNELTFAERFNTEIGVRMDHYYLLGDGFSIASIPVFNPRLNIDVNIFKNKKIIESLDISAGSGLFATIDDIVFMIEKKHNISEIRPNRAWTSVLGAKLGLPQGINLTVEGYYKYIFSRMYIPVMYETGFDAGESTRVRIEPKFDGEGMVWGIDLMLQKLQSRFWDGWISYSYSWVNYREPSSAGANTGISGGRQGTDWYFPYFHRYHNLNLVLNFKPAPKFNIYTRFGIASGTQQSRRVGDGPESYPVFMYDPNNPEAVNLVERYSWPSVSDESNRTPFTLPLDVKFSIYGSNKAGKARYEVYVAIENLLALVYKPERDVSFNSYTGEVDSGGTRATYGMPVPIPSFGFKYSY